MGAARHKTIHEYFTDAYRRAERRDLPAGTSWARGEGLQAAFSVRLAPSGRIDSVQYRCSTCITLVALCEHLSVVVVGLEAQEACALTPEALLQWHPEIPPERQGRAPLAIEALRSGVSHADNGGHA